MRSFGFSLILAGACLLAGCAADGASTDGTSRGRSDGTVRPAGDTESGDGEVRGTMVNLGPEATEQLEGFLNSGAVLLGDTVEVDASRKPFLSRMSFAQSISATRLADGSWGPAVLQTKTMDGPRGLLTLTFENMSGTTKHEASLPHVRFGDGFEVYATKKLVIRFWTAQTVERPIHFTAVAKGHAFHQVADSDMRHDGEIVQVAAEARHTGTGYRFENVVEAR